jgi:hypothetical protein
LTGTAGTDVGLTTFTGTLTPVNAGYYLIKVILTDGDKTAGDSDVVHIYKDLTTDAVFSFGAADFTEAATYGISLSETETAVPTLSWSTFTGSAWTQTAADKYTSANKSDSSASWLKLTISTTTSCTVAARMTASSESNYDWGYMSNLDGSASISSVIYQVSGTSSESYAYSVPAGDHDIYFGYVKDGSESHNNDCVTVEVVSIQSAAVGITFGNNIPVSGTLAPVTGTVGSDFTITAYSDAACTTAISTAPVTVGADWTWTLWIPARPSQTAYFKTASSTWSLTSGGVSEAVTLGPEVKTGVAVPAPVITSLGGAVTLDGEALVGNTLTAVTSGLTGQSGTIHYQWKAGGNAVGTDSDSYPVTAADLGKSITVTVTSSRNSGSVTSSATEAVSWLLTVTWKNNDGTTLKTDTVNYGETPVYTGATPMKATDANYSYMFTGWSPTIAAVSANTTYTAQFVSHALSKVSTIIFGGGPVAEDLGNLGNPATSISWNEGASLTAVVDTSAGTWANGAAFAWYMDGVILSGQTSDSITVSARNYVPGTHTFMVKVTKGEESYSKTVVFTITE